MYLEEIMRDCHSTKLEHKHYCEVYESHFGRDRLKISKLLEIGIQSGGSLKGWAKYFPNSEIHGIDILEKCKKHETDRIKVFIGSQEDKEFLKQFSGYDIIIDDGGHTMKQQRRSFQTLFPLLNVGGIYVVEDLHTSYWPEFGGGYLGKKTMITVLKGIIDNLNYKAFKHNKRAIKNNMDIGWLDKNVESLHFYKSICFIYKKGLVEK